VCLVYFDIIIDCLWFVYMYLVVEKYKNIVSIHNTVKHLRQRKHGQHTYFFIWSNGSQPFFINVIQCKCLPQISSTKMSFNVPSNLPKRPPLVGSRLYLKVTFSCHNIENIIWIESLLRGHLSYKAMFDPIFQPPTLTFSICNYSTLTFASDLINFYTEFG
jgi:hypothetical protein